MIYCGGCGAELKPGVRFCGVCGTEVAPLPLPVRRPSARRAGIGSLDAAGAVLALAGSFLPWLTFAGTPANAWSLSIAGLVTGADLGGSGPVAAVLVLPVLVIAVAILSRRALPGHTLFWLGALVTVTAGLAAVRGLSADPRLGLGAGLALSAAGGLVLVAADLRVDPSARSSRIAVPLVLVVALAAAALFAATRDRGEPATIEAAVPTPQVRTVDHAETGVHLEVPPAWEVTQDGGVLSADGDGIDIDAALESRPPGDLREAIAASYAGEPTYRQVGLEDVRFGGQDALRHEFDITRRDTVLRIVEFLVTRPSVGDRVVRFIVAVRADEKDAKVATIEQVLASVRIDE